MALLPGNLTTLAELSTKSSCVNMASIMSQRAMSTGLWADRAPSSRRNKMSANCSEL